METGHSSTTNNPDVGVSPPCPLTCWIPVPPEVYWARDVVCWTDSGFQGLKKDYPQLAVIQPKKKPKGGDRPAWEQFINTQKARIRIRVEHAIGGAEGAG